MSGHSKWSKVKHQKKSTDAAKGKIFTKLTNAIIIAVREGGGSADPQSNFKLRLAVEKARSFNVPKDNINRAVEKGKGLNEGESLSQAIYEAFGPGGVGIIIEAATNNKQRTVSELKNILERGGGTLTASGAVSRFFKFVGLITVEKKGMSVDEIMEAALQAGASDLEDSGDMVDIYTNPTDLHKVKEKITAFRIEASSCELSYRPISTVSIQDADVASSLLKLLAKLEEADDVQRVFANFDIPDEYLL